ncbi:cell division protein FtsQ/DivIB [Chloroflexota bacterium]
MASVTQGQPAQSTGALRISTARKYARVLAHSRFWSAAILLALIATIVYASASESFFVREVQVTGATHLDPAIISDAAGAVKQSVFWLDPREVANVVIKIPGVKSVRVQCSLPSKVTIDVREREPVVLWRAESQGRDWWIDEDGVVLAYHGDPDSESTVFVIDSSERHLQVGERIDPRGLVQSVKQLAAALPGTKYFYYQEDRGLSFLHQADSGQWPAYVGSSDDLARKIQSMEVVIDYLKAKNIRPTYVDVRWAEHPVYRVRKGDGGE